ncbi:MAG: hypothetical protein RR383_09355, partial [Muribaculaceae bacterium]
ILFLQRELTQNVIYFTSGTLIVEISLNQMKLYPQILLIRMKLNDKPNNMKRKYARFGDEKSGVYECTNRKCKWQGTTDEQKYRKKDDIGYVHICPKCGNDEFYSLIK